VRLVREQSVLSLVICGGIDVALDGSGIVELDVEVDGGGTDAALDVALDGSGIVELDVEVDEFRRAFHEAVYPI
jgi:hypothetical protein